MQFLPPSPLETSQTYRHTRTATKVEMSARTAEPLRRARAWMTTLRKINMGLIGRSVPTELVHQFHPASTDGERIKFDTDTVLDMLRGDHRKGVAGVLGLNYHECSHILYSPSPGGSPLVTRLKYRAKERKADYRLLFGLCNCLEDQRIESLFTGKYGRAKHYFTVSTTALLLDDSEAGTDLERAWSAFFLSMGRMYLQPNLRDGFRRAFVKAYDEQAAATPHVDYEGGGAALARDVFGLYQRYASEDLLGTTAAQKRAGDVVAELYDLVYGAGLYTPRDRTGHDGQAPGEHGDPGRKDSFAGRPDVSEEVKRLTEELAEEEDRLGGEPDETGDPGEGEPEGSDAPDGSGDVDGSGATEGDADGSGDAEGEGPAQPEDGDTGPSNGEDSSGGEDITTNSGSEADDSGGNASGGNGAGSSKDGRKKTAHDLLEEALDDMSGASSEALDDDGIREDYERLTEKAEQDSNDGGEITWDDPSLSRRKSRKPDRPVADARQTAERCEDVLRRLRADAGSYWVRGVESGRRINPVKFHGRQPWDQNFWDAHEEGQEDEFDIEVVVLLDMSGSMTGDMGKASAAVWAIHRAFHAIGGRVWVIGFSDGVYGLIRGDALPSETIPYFDSIGGTSPLAALKEANRILSSPTCADKSRYLLTVTDGVWSSADKCDIEVAQMNNSGVITSYVYLDTSGGYSRHDLSHLDDRHFHKTGVNMTDIGLLPDLMEQIVRQRLAQAGR